MLHIGLTGNIAAGKSTVVELFRRWGAEIIDADQLAREAQRPGTDVFRTIVERFGPDVVGSDGALDRPVLRRRVLASADALASLNAIVHPAVRQAAAERLDALARQGARIVVSDIPLLFETGDAAGFDAVVLVDAPLGVRRERLLRERRLSADDADAMLAAQLPSAPKRDQSTFVIDNDRDFAELERNARRVWEQIESVAFTRGRR